MARIKLKLGENEIEVDSRDFYVDNQTLWLDIKIMFLTARAVMSPRDVNASKEVTMEKFSGANGSDEK